MNFQFCYLILSLILIPADAKSQALINLSQPPLIAEIFAKEIISDGLGNRDFAVSPDGKEIFYTIQYRGFALSAIMYSRKMGNRWSVPEVASFSGQFADLEPAFSPDGKKLYFSSNRQDEIKKTKDFDIWYVTKIKDRWTNLTRLDKSINTTKDEFYPSIARSGTIYFTRVMPDKDEDIVYSKVQNNTYDTAVSLPESINTKGAEFNAFVDPDEKFIIYTAYKRVGNLGSGDLYISYKEDGTWGDSKNLGNKINGPGLTYCPYVSLDKKSFFFASNRGLFNSPFEKKNSISEIKKLVNSTSNGLDNIYWIDASQILNK